MSVEDRVRDALRTVAATTQVSPDAFDGVQARIARRVRVRRAPWVVVPVAAAIIGALLVASRPNHSREVRTTTPPAVDSPTVNPGALGGHGRLAFFSSGHLWTLDGASGRLTDLGAASAADGAAWSFDGEWLAWGDPLRVARWNGADAHEVVRGSLESWTWSPARAELAVVVGNVLTLFDVLGDPPRIVKGVQGSVGPLAWSDDGETIAITSRVGTRSSIKLLAAHGAGAMAGVASTIDELRVVGWWPYVGPLFLRDSALEVLLPGKAEEVTLSPNAVPKQAFFGIDPATNELTVADGGEAAVGHPTRFLVCQPEPGATCTARPSPSGTPAFAPTWSPDGRELAWLELDVDNEIHLVIDDRRIGSPIGQADWTRDGRLVVASGNGVDVAEVSAATVAFEAVASPIEPGAGGWFAYVPT